MRGSARDEKRDVVGLSEWEDWRREFSKAGIELANLGLGLAGTGVELGDRSLGMSGPCEVEEGDTTGEDMFLSSKQSAQVYKNSSKNSQIISSPRISSSSLH